MTSRSGRRTTGFIIAGLLVALLIAGGVSHFASGDPDGLDSATLDGCTLDADGEITGGTCVAQHADDHEIGGPFADYTTAGISDETLSGTISGILGTLVVFGIGVGGFWLIRRRNTTEDTN